MTSRPTRPATRPATRIAGLDGLRAIAVAAVLIYHLGAGWLPGGFLGVDLFFVISGFLITTLLLAELQRVGRINYGQFYLRRARRLLPALFVMLVMTLTLVSVLARDVAHQTLRDVPGALLYISNWWALGQDQSYFDLIGRGNPLGHLWSLAVEEQFYLLWPLILGGIALLTKGKVRLGVLTVAGIGALVSTSWMGALAVQHEVPLGSDPTRVYFGTDTHAMSVMAGAALAAVWNVARFRSNVLPGARRVLLGAGVVGLVLSALLMLGLSEYTGWLYRGGFLVTSLVFALVVAAATHPASPLGPALDNPIMRWVGQRSYGIYLFHWPIFLVTRPGQDLPWDGLWVQAVRIALVLAVAELSYRYVEVPVRRGTFPTGWLNRRAVALAAVLACAVGVLLATAPNSTQVAAQQALGSTSDIADVVPPATEDATDALDAQTMDIAWYGDSVTLWSVDALRAQFPGVAIDAGLNRAPSNILHRVQQAAPQVDVVVLHLGNAGPVSASTLAETLGGLAAVERVVLINSNASFPWAEQANDTIASVGSGFDNVVLVDWDAIAEGQSAWFEDGLHLTEVGKEAFAAAARDAIEQ